MNNEKSSIYTCRVITSKPVFKLQNKIWDETEKEKAERLAWWTEARFGMFIHWGLYAQAARHEWVKNHDASEIKLSEPLNPWIKASFGENDIYLQLPVNKPNVEIPVTELFLKKYS